MKRWLKRIAATSGILILLIGLLLGLTQTSFFRNWLKNQLVERSNEYLNGQLSIADIEGNLFTHIRARDILVTTRDDTVLYIPSLKIDLTPSRLFHLELKIDSVTVDSPYVKLVQADDSGWNFATLILTDTLTLQDTAPETDTSNFRIVLDDFILRDGTVRLVALDTTLPEAIERIGVRFAGQYSDTAQQLNFKGLSFNLRKPVFRLEQLSFDASRRGNKITLGNLVIRTDQNRFGGQGTYVASDNALSSGQLASEPINFAEFRAFVPELNISGNPLFEIEAQLKRDSLAAKLSIIESPQRIDIGLDVANVSRALNAATHAQVRYYLNINLTDFSLTHWLGDTAMDVRTSGTVTLAGTGFTPDEADIVMDMNLTNSHILDMPIDRITGTARYTTGDLDGRLETYGNFGEIYSDFKITDILELPVFDVDLKTSHLNLAFLLHADSLESDINLVAKVQGSGFDISRLAATGRVDAASSLLFGIQVDTLFAKGAFTGDSYHLDTLHAALAPGEVSLTGQGKFDGDQDLAYKILLTTLAPIRQVLTDVDTVSGTGVISGVVRGTLDSLQISGDMELHQFQYNEVKVESALSQYTALLQGDNISGRAGVSVYMPGSGDFIMDSAVASAEFSTTEADIAFDGFYQPGIQAHMAGLLAFDSSNINSTIKDIALIFNRQHWRGGGPETRLVISGDDYHIENLILRSSADSAGAVPSISINGLVSLTGFENMTLAINHLDLEQMLAAFDLPDEIAGQLNAELQLGGTAASPTVTGRLAIDNGRVNQFSYRALRGQIGYEAERLEWTTALLPRDGDSLAITGNAPINLSMTNDGDAVYYDRPFEVNVSTSGLPLSIILASGQALENVNGYITADINISNTIDTPVVKGQVGLRDGSLSMPEYGIEYTKISAGLSVHDAVLTLDTLQAVRDRGILTGKGSLQFENNLISGVIKTSELEFLANSFYALKHKDFQVSISGNARLTGNSDEPRFAGSITVLRSSIFLPALMEEAAAAQAGDESMPLLVRATLAPDTLADSSAAGPSTEKAPSYAAQTDWYNNLRGQFKVTIPRNTWLRSPDMNIEIGEGDLDLVKNGPEFELFGSLKIMRGQYNLYGRRFMIVQGDLFFQGGTDYNPEVTMRAQYVFRNAEREKKVLTLDVSGKAFTPTLRFALDDVPIEEKDAIAYVIYGRSMDELTSGQQSTASVAEADLARGAAANILSNQLSRTLGSTLGLDVIDISSQGTLASTTMTVGKYVSNNLFMSYQRAMGQTQGEEAIPEIVTLEYELHKYLFLQLLHGDDKTSGLDFIFKYQR